MAEIRLPQYGMGMTDGTISEWRVSVGDQVTAGQILCEIEAAKTNVDFESPVAGVVAKILVAVGQNVPVNTPLLEIDESGLAIDSTAAPAPAEAQPSPSSSTARATPLARRLAEQQGVDLAGVQGSGPNGRIRRDDVAGAASGAPAIESRPQVQIEPRARKAAQDLGVDLALIKGTGPQGRIVAEDVTAFAEAGKTPAPAPPSEASGDAAGCVEIRHSMMRKTIARRLTESKQTVPHFYLKASCRIDALLAARKAVNAEQREKVSVNDFVIRAIALALREVPEANVTWDEKAMRQYEHVDIAVAVATPRGLVTPVVRAADTKSIRQIAAEVKELAGRGREGKLEPHEYQGGTTSISNLGMFGVEEFSAIINPPQSTIFAVGAGESRVIPIDGNLGIATMMTVTVSIDHRAVDGAVGAQLLAAFKALIEQPARIVE